MKTKPIYSTPQYKIVAGTVVYDKTPLPIQTAVAIYDNYASTPVFATLELVKQLEGESTTFHEIKRLENARLLPRIGTEGNPTTVVDFNFALENENLGKRKWVWKKITQGRYYEFGYGYIDGNYFQFCNSRGEPTRRVLNKK